MKEQEIIDAVKKSDEQNEIKYWKYVLLASKIKFTGIIEN
jgi:hypothetical protein